MDKNELEVRIKRVSQISDSDLENRFAYHKPKNENVALVHGLVREKCLELANFINDVVPPGREQALAITNLEQVMMWANAGIAREE